MSNISTTKKSFIFFLIFQMIYARASSSPSNEELSGKHAGHDPLGHGARQAVSMHCIPRIAHPRSLASCCDRIHLVGSSSGAIHPPGNSIHASKHPCTLLHSLNRSMCAAIFPHKITTSVCLGFFLHTSSMMYTIG